MSKWLSLLIFGLVVMVVASTGAKFGPGPWYVSLNKPWWTPPNWLFPVAWTILYAMIAVAGWLIWSRAGFNRTLAVWAVGLILNGLWSYLMFGQQKIDLALADVVALWVSIAAFIWMALPIDLRAGLLFVPYLAWVSFAALLNYTIWRMN